MPTAELTSIRGYLHEYRLTLARQCADLVRHLAGVEHIWLARLRGTPGVAMLFRTADNPDHAFDGAVADPAVVDDAFKTWRAQIADLDRWLDEVTDLDATGSVHHGKASSVRDILIHLIEEYARHCGHADLLRECIDGRTGQ